MSHEFESGFFVGQSAWHKLGTVLTQPPTTAQAIVEAGLDWQVLEETFDLEFLAGESKIQYKRLIRDYDQKVLGTVPSNYVPLQNCEAFRWFDSLLDRGGLELEAAGSLKNGQRIWILAKLTNTEATIRDGDRVRPYLLLHNTHDGSTAVWIQFTPVRVVCWNTLSGATRNRFGDVEQQKAICIPHAASIRQQLDKVKHLIDLTHQEFQYSIEEYQAMLNQEMSPDLLQDYLENIKVYMRRVLRLKSKEVEEALQQFMLNFQQGSGNRGQTLWDAYNAVTEWIDHQWGEFPDERLVSSWFGQGAKLRRISHEIAVNLVMSRVTKSQETSKV